MPPENIWQCLGTFLNPVIVCALVCDEQPLVGVEAKDVAKHPTLHRMAPTPGSESPGSRVKCTLPGGVVRVDRRNPHFTVLLMAATLL